MKYPSPVALMATLLLAPHPGRSQTDEPATMETIVVTGSNLKRSDRESPQAMAVLDRKKIEQSGARTVQELILKLPQNSGGTNENVNTGNSFSPGASGASLRGLGLNSTLVLLNGRRVAPFPFADNGTDAFVDLNAIPLSAIERIEILKEGASAIYGSDAIAGVINIILKDNYTGFETETYYGNTTRKDAGEFRQSFVTGFDSGKLHLFLTGNYYHRNPLAAVDRSFSASANHRALGGSDLRSDYSNPGTISTSNGYFAVPRGSQGRLAISDFLPGQIGSSVTLRNRYDYNPDSELIPETERWGGLLTFRYDLAPHAEVFGEASYQSTRTKSHISASVVDGQGDKLSIPSTHPFNPFREDVTFFWRSIETGLRRDTTESDSYRYLAGFRLVDLPRRWTAEATFLYSESNVVNYSTGGYLSAASFRAALDDPNPKTALNLFGDGRGINRSATLHSLLAQPRNDGLAYLYNYSIKAGGDLFDLPGGPVSVAFGGEYRDEFLSQRFSVPLGSVIGIGGAGSEGARAVRSLFIEGSIPLAGKGWNLPLLRALELTVAERLDDYSDFGDSAKPKFGFKWKPCAGLLLRGAYSEGFRAPSLPQLFTGVVTGFTNVTNPRTKATQEVKVVTGGNPELSPETSYSYFLGGLVEPPFAKGLSIGVDYYHIDQRNLISSPIPQDILSGKASGTVLYGANNRITSVEALYTNLGAVIVEGVDVDVNYRFDTRFGLLTFASSLAYVAKYRQSSLPGGKLFDYTDSFALPEFKMVHSLFYKKGGFEAGVTLNYIDSYTDRDGSGRRPSHTVGSWTTVDLQCSYEWLSGESSPSAGWRRWLDNTKVTIGCTNAGDAQPPFANLSEGYDPQTADATGRFIYASLRKKFW